MKLKSDWLSLQCKHPCYKLTRAENGEPIFENIFDFARIAYLGCSQHWLPIRSKDCIALGPGGNKAILRALEDKISFMEQIKWAMGATLDIGEQAVDIQCYTPMHY